MQINKFIYFVHSNMFWIHSNNKNRRRIVIKAEIRILEIILILIMNINGMMMLISISNMRNIIVTRKKLSENGGFLEFIILKPHSNEFIFSHLEVLVFSIIRKKIKVNIDTMKVRIIVRYIIVINFFLIKWKLIVHIYWKVRCFLVSSSVNWYIKK